MYQILTARPYIASQPVLDLETFVGLFLLLALIIVLSVALKRY